MGGLLWLANSVSAQELTTQASELPLWVHWNFLQPGRSTSHHNIPPVPPGTTKFVGLNFFFPNFVCANGGLGTLNQLRNEMLSLANFSYIDCLHRLPNLCKISEIRLGNVHLKHGADTQKPGFVFRFSHLLDIYVLKRLVGFPEQHV